MPLSVTGVCKQFGRNTVLENAGFSVREGENPGLTGPNGAGKTTLTA
ncbi:MAG: ATP-binding cassette domain-containing protein [Bryobacteraceae bacterium]|jgi:ABC-type multidrug transport system ATPase subunit